MNIFKEIKNSIYNVSYYKSLPSDKSLGSSIKYLAKLSLLTALATVIFFSFSLPGMYSSVKNMISSKISSYPDDLIVSIKNGVASINKSEPYFIPLDITAPKNISLDKSNIRKNLIVIDTTQPFSFPQFDSYSSYVWLTKTEIIIIKDNNQLQILPLAKVKNIEITKAWILSKESILMKTLPWIITLLILIAYIFIFLFNFIGTLIIVFVYALAIWLMAKIKKVELSYKDSYKIGIHAATLLLILGTFITHLNLPYYSIIKLIIIVILVYINFFKNHSLVVNN